MTAAQSRTGEDWLQLIILIGAALGVLGGWIGFLVRHILRWLDDQIASGVRELRDALEQDRREVGARWDLQAQQMAVVGGVLDRIDSRIGHVESRLDDHLTHHEGDGR